MGVTAFLPNRGLLLFSLYKGAITPSLVIAEVYKFFLYRDVLAFLLYRVVITHSLVIVRVYKFFSL